MRPIKVWDLPTRVFHWALVVLIFLAWLTQQLEADTWHYRIGETILTLLLFRVAWGFVGSDTARFVKFLRSPLAALEHLSHLRGREPDTEIGHNAAGGWMVLVLLGLLALQTGTGLFSQDEDVTEGPLKHLISDDQSNFIARIHATVFWVILAAVAMHVAAVTAYVVLKRHDLVRPMLTGTKSLPSGTPAPRLVSPLWALPILAAAAGAVTWLVRL